VFVCVCVCVCFLTKKEHRETEKSHAHKILEGKLELNVTEPSQPQTFYYFLRMGHRVQGSVCWAAFSGVITVKLTKNAAGS
jgi:hypothetical protein